MATITVPPTSPGDKVTGYRRTVRDVGLDLTGMEATTGTWLHGGDLVEVPEGALILAVDKTTTGWGSSYSTGAPYPIHDATVTVHLVQDDGTLSILWTRHFKTAKSALSKTTITRLAKLLDEHPAPHGSPEVVKGSRRPNRRAGTCRWCGGHIDAGSTIGHLVGHGGSIDLEHFEDCPPRSAAAGTPCALCSVTVTMGSAQQHLNRETNAWETRHYAYLRCTEQRRSLEANAAETRKAAARREARAAMVRQERAERLTEIEAEEKRIATIPVVQRITEVVNDRGIGGTRRAQLQQHIDTLEDGTTVTRWEVVITDSVSVARTTTPSPTSRSPPRPWTRPAPVTPIGRSSTALRTAPAAAMSPRTTTPTATTAASATPATAAATLPGSPGACATSATRMRITAELRLTGDPDMP